MPTNRSNVTPSSSDDRSSTNHKTVFNRSRITNGRCLLPGVSRRSHWARRFYDVVHLYASDQGGDDNLSEGRRSLIRRVACMQVELELLETKFAAAGGADAGDLDLYQRTAGNLRRLIEGLGMDRIPRDVTPTLDQYLRMKREAEVLDEADA